MDANFTHHQTHHKGGIDFDHLSREVAQGLTGLARVGVTVVVGSAFVYVTIVFGVTVASILLQ